MTSIFLSDFCNGNLFVITDNDIGNAGAKAISETFKPNQTIKKLDLSKTVKSKRSLFSFLVSCGFAYFFVENKIGPEGGKAIAEGLKGSSSLKKLNLQ